MSNNKNIKYRQCTLTRNLSGQTVQQVSYIPEKFAIVGEVLKLKNDEDIWESGWKVTQAGQDLVPEEFLPDWRKAIRVHRSETGDSLPKEPAKV